MMAQWLEQLKEKTTKSPQPVVTQVTELPFGTSVTSSQDCFSDFRFIESLDDLTPTEHTIVMWLFERSLVYPYQLAAYLKVPLGALEPLLVDLDKNRFILRCDGMMAINVYGKYKLGLIGPQERYHG